MPINKINQDAFDKAISESALDLPKDTTLNEENLKAEISRLQARQGLWVGITGLIKEVLRSWLIKWSIIAICVMFTIAFIYVIFVAVFGYTDNASQGETYIPWGKEPKLLIGLSVQQAQDIVAYVLFLILGGVAGKYSK